MTRGDELRLIQAEIDSLSRRLVALRTNEPRLSDFDTSITDAIDGLSSATHHIRTASDDLTYAADA